VLEIRLTYASFQWQHQEYVLGAIAQGPVWKSPSGFRGKAPVEGLGSPEAEAFCRYCSQVMNTDTIRI